MIENGLIIWISALTRGYRLLNKTLYICMRLTTTGQIERGFFMGNSARVIFSVQVYRFVTLVTSVALRAL